jgi:formate dehydrogenase iron-sulfur subunit
VISERLEAGMVAQTRREILATLAAAAGGTAARPSAAESPPTGTDPYGVLVDTTVCIGCRKCEWACNQSNHLPAEPVRSFEDTTVFTSMRRPDAAHFTVVNRFLTGRRQAKPTFVKVQCMHCSDPACCSACLVGALEKQPDGAVTYTPWRCMGCRYCMVVCPFQVPAYEYRNALSPTVRKCTFCHERVAKEGKLPACVEICPPQCLSFGRRSELLRLAHGKIEAGGGRYAHHVYGEHEVGGTSWLYLTSVEPGELGFPALGDVSPARLTESLQHGVFKGFIPPLALFALLFTAMTVFRPDEQDSDREGGGR